MQQNYYDNKYEEYHYLHEQRDEGEDNPEQIEEKRVVHTKDNNLHCNSYPGRHYWNLNDAIGISTSKILENILKVGLDKDASLGGVGTITNGSSKFSIANNFVCGNGEIIWLKLPQNSTNERNDIADSQESPRTRYLKHEYDRKKRGITNYNNSCMKYYAGWNWNQKRQQATLSLRKILRRFASRIVHKLMKEKMIDRRLPKQAILNRILLASPDNGSKEQRRKHLENPEEAETDWPITDGERSRQETSDMTYDNSNILCLQWQVDPNVTHYKLEQMKTKGYNTIYIDPPVEDVGRQRPKGSFKVINLKPNTQYEFRLTPCNKNGYGKSTIRSFYTTPKKPAKPKVFSITYNTLQQVAFGSVTLCWGMDSYALWLKKLRRIFDKLRGEKNLKNYLDETPIAMKFILHCQKINSSKLSFDMFKDFCAHHNFGFTPTEQRRCEKLESRLRRQKKHPDLGLGYLSLDRSNGVNTKGAYEVWCKVTAPSQSFTHNYVTQKHHLYKESYLNKYIKVWEGLEEACTVSHLRCGYQYAFQVVRSNLHGERAYGVSLQ